MKRLIFEFKSITMPKIVLGYIGMSVVLFAFSIVSSDLPIFSSENFTHAFNAEVDPYMRGLIRLLALWLVFALAKGLFDKPRKSKLPNELTFQEVQKLYLDKKFAVEFKDEPTKS